MIDFASNDYLALAHNKKNAQKAFSNIAKLGQFGSKASQLVNGYSQIHKKLEERLADAFGFENCVLFGSGYLANLALAGNLPRRGDTILMDEEYHASGKVGVKLSGAKTIFFKHNDAEDLREKLKNSAKNTFVFVEGVYSMIGDILNADVVKTVDEYGAYLIIDEAHSVGTIGDNLLGAYSALNLTPKKTHIKMGTFSKALGSYGAYIVCDNVISRYLQNRASSLIYTTAPSLFDIAFANENFKTLLKNGEDFAKKLKNLRKIYESNTNERPQTQIAMYDKNVYEIYENLTKNGFAVGLIRPPTIVKPSLRITLSLGSKISDLNKALKLLTDLT